MADREWGDAPEVIVTSIDGEAAPDIRRRPAWWRVASSVAALAVAFAVGVGVGRETGSAAPTVAPSTSAEPATGPATVRATGARCAVPTANGLWLGAELFNDGPGIVVLRGARVVLPLGGLHATGLVWGGCGELDATAAHGPDAIWKDLLDLPANSSVWVSAPFEVLEADRCLAPIPVLFRATYLDRTGRIAELELGFPDLGDVPHAACQEPG